MSNPFDQFDDAAPDQGATWAPTSDPRFEVERPNPKAPRGLRNNNALNVTGSGWAGQTGSDGKFATFATPEDGRAAADANLAAYHRKHGIDTVAGVVSRWAPPSENDTQAYIRHVSTKLGVDPNQPLGLDDPSARSRLLDVMSAHETPGSVTANPFDQFDVAALEPPPRVPGGRTMTNEEMIAAGVTQAAPSRTGPKGSPADKVQPPPSAPVDRLPDGDTSLMGDVWSGFTEPFRALGHDAHQYYDHRMAAIKAGKTGGGFFDIPQLAGDVLGLPGAPVQAAIRPIADIASRILPPMKATHVEWRNGIPGRYIDGDMPRGQAQAAIENDINTALQGGRPVGVNMSVPPGPHQPTKIPGANLTEQLRAIAPQMPVQVRSRPMALPELKAASDAAWAKVDASGYRFAPKDLNAMAADVRQIVQDAGPELYPDAARVSARIDSMARGGTLTPAQANRLRSQVGEKLLQPGSTEASVGGAIKARIDALIDTANDPNLGKARNLYTRYKKVQDVTQRLEDAGLNQAGAGTGGNLNAARQALKPLVKNKGTQRMRNASPAEMAALKKVVKGGVGQNLLRAASAFDPFHGRLGMLLQGGMGLKTGGASLLTVPLGMAATAGERALAQRNIEKLLDLLSTGGKPPPKAKVSPRGLIGSGVVAAPVVRAQERPR